MMKCPKCGSEIVGENRKIIDPVSLIIKIFCLLMTAIAFLVVFINRVD